MDFCPRLVRTSGEFHANNVTIGIKFDAVNVPNWAIRTLRLAVNTGSLDSAQRFLL